jgi:hypothetical protein
VEVAAEFRKDLQLLAQLTFVQQFLQVSRFLLKGLQLPHGSLLPVFGNHFHPRLSFFA